MPERIAMKGRIVERVFNDDNGFIIRFIDKSHYELRQDGTVLFVNFVNLPLYIQQQIDVNQ